MTMIAAEVAPAALQPVAALFRSLADPARLAIVRQLATGPARVVDLTRPLGLAQSTVSKHLACLRDCGLVTARPAGPPCTPWPCLPWPICWPPPKSCWKPLAAPSRCALSAAARGLPGNQTAPFRQQAGDHGRAARLPCGRNGRELAGSLAGLLDFLEDLPQ
jgi:hypothetical protein